MILVLVDQRMPFGFMRTPHDFWNLSSGEIPGAPSAAFKTIYKLLDDHLKLTSSILFVMSPNEASCYLHFIPQMGTFPEIRTRILWAEIEWRLRLACSLTNCELTYICTSDPAYIFPINNETAIPRLLSTGSVRKTHD